MSELENKLVVSKKEPVSIGLKFVEGVGGKGIGVHEAIHNHIVLYSLSSRSCSCRSGHPRLHRITSTRSQAGSIERAY